MRKNELSRHYFLKREIQQTRSKINELSECANLTNIDGIVDNKEILRDKIKRLRKAYFLLSQDIENYIATVQDPEMAEIIRMRNLDHLSWDQIAKRLKKDDLRYATKKYNRFFREN